MCDLYGERTHSSSLKQATVHYVIDVVFSFENKHKIYCQICKCNVSIRAKGPKEILRHYATKRHLRKDQRWRYEHLTIEDLLTKRLRYQVRGRDGKVLSNYQLQLELPFHQLQLIISLRASWLTLALSCHSMMTLWLVETT